MRLPRSEAALRCRRVVRSSARSATDMSGLEQAAKEKRQQLFTACEEILGQVKQKTFVELAKEHNVYDEYIVQAKVVPDVNFKLP